MFSYTLLTVLAATGVSLASVVRLLPFEEERQASSRVPVYKDEFSTQASLQYKGNHKCGASILSSKWVTTAAQCVGPFSLPDLSILAGTDKYGHKGSIHQVDKVIMHSNFSYMTGLNDIAVLQVSPPLSIGKTETPVRLPVQGEPTTTNSTATLITWQYDSEGENLKKRTVLIMDHEQCVNVYKDFIYHVSDSEICITVPGGHKDKCYGDAGSSLFVKGEMVGLASWSEGCAVSGTPSVFTRVSSYRSWIKAQTGV